MKKISFFHLFAILHKNKPQITVKIMQFFV